MQMAEDKRFTTSIESTSRTTRRKPRSQANRRPEWIPYSSAVVDKHPPMVCMKPPHQTPLQSRINLPAVARWEARFTAPSMYAMPVFGIIETLLVKKLNFEPTRLLRFFVRNIYVASTMFVGITFPFFSGLLGFFGGFFFAPTSYFLPCVIWLIIYKPRNFSLSWWTNWISIVFGVLLTVIAPLGGLRQIILQAKTYKFYS